MRREKHTRLMFDDIRVDIRQIMEGRKVKHFVINVALVADNKVHDVFRIDTAHGYLHMQKFWISNEPIKLRDRRKDNYAGDFGYWKNKVEKEWRTYVELYRKMKR